MDVYVVRDVVGVFYDPTIGREFMRSRPRAVMDTESEDGNVEPFSLAGEESPKVTRRKVLKGSRFKFRRFEKEVTDDLPFNTALKLQDGWTCRRLRSNGIVTIGDLRRKTSRYLRSISITEAALQKIQDRLAEYGLHLHYTHRNGVMNNGVMK